MTGKVSSSFGKTHEFNNAKRIIITEDGHGGIDYEITYADGEVRKFGTQGYNAVMKFHVDKIGPLTILPKDKD